MSIPIEIIIPALVLLQAVVLIYHFKFRKRNKLYAPIRKWTYYNDLDKKEWDKQFHDLQVETGLIVPAKRDVRPRYKDWVLYHRDFGSSELVFWNEKHRIKYTIYEFDLKYMSPKEIENELDDAERSFIDRSNTQTLREMSAGRHYTQLVTSLPPAPRPTKFIK